MQQDHQRQDQKKYVRQGKQAGKQRITGMMTTGPLAIGEGGSTRPTSMSTTKLSQLVRGLGWSPRRTQMTTGSSTWTISPTRSGTSSSPKRPSLLTWGGARVEPQGCSRQQQGPQQGHAHQQGAGGAGAQKGHPLCSGAWGGIQVEPRDNSQRQYANQGGGRQHQEARRMKKSTPSGCLWNRAR